MPMVSGESPADWRDAVFSQIGDVEMIRTAEEKLNVYGGEAGEYYNLGDDPREFVNRIKDGDAVGRIEELKGRVKEWRTEFQA